MSKLLSSPQVYKEKTVDNSFQSEMSVFCPLCDKQFANKQSLSSHKSRYHRKKGESHTSSINHPPAKAYVTNVKGDNHEYSDVETTISEEYYQDSSNSEAASVDDESKTEYDNVTSRDMLDSDSLCQRKGKRKGVAIKQINKKVKMSTFIKTLDVLSQRNLCKEEDKRFDFLSSYIIKHKVFETLKQRLNNSRQDIATILTLEERSLLDAVITTTTLSDVNKLMNENKNIVNKILEL